MSIGILNKKFQDNNQDLEVSENSHNISISVIPFSFMFKKIVPPDIYTGEEIIAFRDKDSEFKQILKYEFIMD
ncbi:hypothetical protein LCGC14_1128420 [marine sediment metagenome]|uniref:Uncharacterized protein n=1 Tax=marine sediment metagenome TaxID=412755 RepID=A0A0F9M1Y8_9ZZZZ